ncbi:FAD:protein FMN transferase [Flavobacterium aquatile]|uniref:FAD:protein FMN transferase n=1 Tax=Flavobacterium aquatile LMG 4008 = ATCC 11947 TaxID=1453498 RepID=A0A095UYV7_9FLAO|nr:FAD:protein FMN transferase [Flavobacterium aquatile]KGD67760.1 thiamine biosynthesis protein ApbE [Flavobacterium aquatile LMG 4008 = ATCC 11947]OXA67621.1 thiamine biosynthesis protein ApbE [Flavobacterium aquatile LMG 4008 = ATCC 11947]GEC78255.1 FAD:protein FMN transferase [Flavobacterium aquatile]
MKKYLFIVFLTTISSFGQTIYKRKLAMLGSPFEISVVANDSIKANEYSNLAINEVKRIENLISDWIPTTQISEINKNAGIQPIKVDEEVFDLVERAIKISKLTNGAFDISYASMDKIWKFDGSMKEMPTPEAIKKSVERIGYQNIILDKENKTIFLKLSGMKLGLGGIGQGYIADKVKELLQSKGCTSGLVNVSGDINTWGKQPNGELWTVGIVNPMNKNKVFATFPLDNSAVETSGSYEKFVSFNGIRYSHIIDPRTGYPATGIVSVSVFAKQTEIADALATGIFVLGVEVGLDLVNQLKGIECIIVDDKGKIHASKGIDIKKYKI